MGLFTPVVRFVDECTPIDRVCDSGTQNCPAADSIDPHFHSHLIASTGVSLEALLKVTDCTHFVM